MAITAASLIVSILLLQCVADDSVGLNDKNVEKILSKLDRLEALIQLLHDATTKSLKSDKQEKEFSPEGPSLSSPQQLQSRTVARYKAAWSDSFQFHAAVRVDASVSCLHFLPHEGDGGFSRYLAIGDSAGHLYIFNSHGDLLADSATTVVAPITAILSLLLRRNETLLITGHANGAVVAFRIHGGAAASTQEQGQWGFSIAFTHAYATEETVEAIAKLEMYRVGRMRYLMVSDSGGKFSIFRDNGTLYGSAQSPSKPLVFLRTTNPQRLLFLTQSGIAALDLRSMSIKANPCEGISSSTALAYVFDAGRWRAYGVTSDGDLVYVAVSADSLHFGCHVRARYKLEHATSSLSSSTLYVFNSYLLLLVDGQLAVYNTSGAARSSGALLLKAIVTTTMEEVSAAAFLGGDGAAGVAAMTCDRDGMVALGFEGGYVGVFSSNLPLQSKGSDLMKHVRNLWSGPVVVAVLVLVLAWIVFGRSKREYQQQQQQQQQLLQNAGAGAGAIGLGAAVAAARSEKRGLERFGSPRRLGSYGGALNYRSGTSIVMRGESPPSPPPVHI